MKKSGLLLFAFALVYPALWYGGRLPGEWCLFTHACWVLAALALLSLVPTRLRNFADCRETAVAHVFFGMIPAGIILLLHYYFSRGNTDIFCNGLWYFVLPLSGAVFAREFRRPLLLAVILLGAADAVYLAVQARQGMPPFGVTGNWNWSATLLAAAFMAGAGLVKRRGIRYVLFMTALCVPLLYLAPQWQGSFPRGTAAAAVMALLLLCGGLIRGKYVRSILAGLCGAILLAGGIWLSQSDADTSRAALAEGTVAMVKAHPMLGVGPGRFESEIPAYLPARYWQGAYPAERHPHPHNELLNMAGEFGISGILLFGIYLMILYRAWPRAAAGLREPGGASAALWGIAVMLTLHGFADVLLDAWPLDAVWLLCIGVLWGESVPEKTAEIPAMEQSEVYWPLRAVQVLFVILLAVEMAKDGVSGFYARRARLGGGHADWAKSRAWKLTPQNVYAGAASALFDGKDPKAALAWLGRMEKATLYRNYLHNRGLTARALAASGKPAGSLPFFELEQRNYPMSAVNLYFHAQVLHKLGRDAEAAQKLAAMQKILAAHGRTAADLPDLMRNPALELRKQ